MSRDGNRPDAAAGDRFPFWLAEACQGTRRLSGATVVSVAELAGVSRGVVHRFEAESHWPKPSGKGGVSPEILVKAYAEACNMPDSRKLWRIAQGLWERYGQDAELPAVHAEKIKQLGADLEQQIDALVQARSKQSGSASARTRRASGKR